MWKIRTSFSDFSRYVAMATDFMAKFRYMCSFGGAAFKNSMQYRSSLQFKNINGNIIATFYANMIKIDLLTPEITRVTNAPFSMRWQKSAYLTKYLTNYWTDLHQRVALVFVCVVITKLTQEVSNQFILGAFCKRRNWPSSLVALAFRNGMKHHLAYVHINSYTNSSTLYKKVVNIGSVVFELNRGKKRNCAATRHKFDDRRPFGTLVSQNGLKDRNSNFRGVNDNHRCTSCRNLVRFILMTWEFKT